MYISQLIQIMAGIPIERLKLILLSMVSRWHHYQTLQDNKSNNNKKRYFIKVKWKAAGKKEIALWSYRYIREKDKKKIENHS